TIASGSREIPRAPSAAFTAPSIEPPAPATMQSPGGRRFFSRSRPSCSLIGSRTPTPQPSPVAGGRRRCVPLTFSARACATYVGSGMFLRVRVFVLVCAVGPCPRPEAVAAQDRQPRVAWVARVGTRQPAQQERGAASAADDALVRAARAQPGIDAHPFGRSATNPSWRPVLPAR